MSQMRRTSIFIFLAIIALLSSALIYTIKSDKKQIATQNVRLSIAIDSVRATVIDSMQQVIQNQVEQTTFVVSKPTPPIELYYLINLFTPNEKMDYNLLDWKTEANNPAINWLTNGIASDSTGFYREGDVVVSISKQVIECLDRNSYPCRWGITLLGPRGGYTSFEISSVTNQALQSMTVDELFKGRKFEVKILKTDEFDNKTYRIKFPQKKLIDMTVQWSCSSAGCSLSIVCSTEIG